MAIESLAQQASTFVDSLTVKPAATEQTEKDVAEEANIPDQGDKVSISEEARALVAIEASGQSEESDEETSTDQIIQSLKDRIEKLQEEIKELKESNLSETENLSKLQEKETQLMEMKDQLVKAELANIKDEGKADGGGTRANGFGNSASSF